MANTLWKKLTRQNVPEVSDWPALYGNPATPGCSIADIADRHYLYQQAVQDVEVEAAFLADIYQRHYPRPANSFREDFCGTAALACQWAIDNPDGYAIGVDLDPDPLNWGGLNNWQMLDAEQQQRVELIEGNVLDAQTDPVDQIAALNFSYWLFTERAQLRTYFERVRAALTTDGMLVLDAFGGSDAYKVLAEDRDCEGFTYRWEQSTFNPVTGDMQCYLHFHFPDGSKLSPAFSYAWRVWSLPELREILQEAGFAKPLIYWHEIEDDEEVAVSEEPSDVHSPDAGWICYLVCLPNKSSNS